MSRTVPGADNQLSGAQNKWNKRIIKLYHGTLWEFGQPARSTMWTLPDELTTFLTHSFDVQAGRYGERLSRRSDENDGKTT